MDIFTRNKAYGRRVLLIGLALLLIGAGLIAYGIIKDDRGEAKPLTALEKGAYGYVELEGFGGPIATREKEYFYLGLLADNSIIIVDVNPTTHALWQGYINDDAAWEAAKPLRLEGRVRATEAQLRTFAESAYTEYGFTSEHGNKAFDTFLSSTRPGGSSSIFMAIGGVAAVLGLIVLILGIMVLRRLKKIRAQLQARYPNRDDFHFLDERKDLDLPALKLFVKDGLLFSERNGLTMAELDDVAWMHLQIINQRYGSTPYLWTYSKSKKNKRIAMPLTGRSSQAVEQLHPLFSYIEQHYPSILLGKTKENRAAYRSRFTA